jgi:hypothetical protein
LRPPPAPGNPGMQTQSAKITQVTEFTGAERDTAAATLREVNWDVERACNRIMEAQTSTRQLLAARTFQRPPPPPTQLGGWARPGGVATAGSAPAYSGTARNSSGNDKIRDLGLGAAMGCVSACVVAICISVL